MKLTVTLFMALIIVSGQARTACPVELGDSHANVKALGLDGLMAANRVIANTTDEVVPFEEFPSKRQLIRICADFEIGINRDKSSIDVLKNRLNIIISKNGYSVTPEDIINTKYSNIKCTHRTSNRVRRTSSLYKYALDRGDYQFIQDTLAVPGCSKSLDYFVRDKVDDKYETVLDFIDLIFKDAGLNANHDVAVLKSIRTSIEFCMNKNGDK